MEDWNWGDLEVGDYIPTDYGVAEAFGEGVPDMSWLDTAQGAGAGLEPTPEVALQNAFNMYRQGEIGNPNYAPTASSAIVGSKSPNWWDSLSLTNPGSAISKILQALSAMKFGQGGVGGTPQRGGAIQISGAPRAMNFNAPGLPSNVRGPAEYAAQGSKGFGDFLQFLQSVGPMLYGGDQSRVS